MLGSVSRIRSARVIRVMLVAVALAFTFSAGFAVRAAFVDERLFLADESLENAHALLLASTPGGATDPRTIRTFERHVRKAVSAVDDAMEAVDRAVAVIEAAD